MTIVTATVPGVKYVRLLLVPFWVVGVIVALVAVVALAVWWAGVAGYEDTRRWLGGDA